MDKLPPNVDWCEVQDDRSSSWSLFLCFDARSDESTLARMDGQECAPKSVSCDKAFYEECQ
jgi:hypothetical protein